MATSSLQAAATLRQPAKVGRSSAGGSSVQLRPVQGLRRRTLRRKTDLLSSTGKITLSVTNSKPETGEVIRVFESIQPSDTDLGSKAPKDVKITCVWYAQLE